jgi:fibro-slime domain-containing protein
MKLQAAAKIISIVIGAMGSVVAAGSASADSLSVQWFTVSISDPDFFGGATGPNCSSDCYNGPYGAVSNFVQSNLGPDGLPVYNTGATLGGQPAPQDRVGSGPGLNQLTWWSPTLNAHVTNGGTSILGMPINDLSVFPPQGTGSSDTPSFQTAILSGILHNTSTTVVFNLGADDDAFLVIDGKVVAQIGGIHDDTTSNFTITGLTLGDHTLQLFYADRNRTNADLMFSIVSGANVNATPLPAALPLFASGLGALGVAAWRRKKKAIAA